MNCRLTSPFGIHLTKSIQHFYVIVNNKTLLKIKNTARRKIMRYFKSYCLFDFISAENNTFNEHVVGSVNVVILVNVGNLGLLFGKGIGL